MRRDACGGDGVAGCGAARVSGAGYDPKTGAVEVGWAITGVRRPGASGSVPIGGSLPVVWR